MKAYLAAGLFNIGEIYVNEIIANLVRELNPGVDLYVPQENSEINDKNAYADSLMIAKADCDKLKEADFLIAVIDGIEIDAGVAAEIGIFSTTGKPIYALYSDSRQQGATNSKKILALKADPTENQFFYRNLFVIGLIKNTNGGVFNSIEDLVTRITLDLHTKGE